MNDSLNAALPYCKNVKCVAYWDGMPHIDEHLIQR